MTQKLNPGDRVRVTANSTMRGYQPGDKGTVLVGPILRRSGQPYYIVAMDKDSGSTTNSIFSADEIEADV